MSHEVGSPKHLLSAEGRAATYLPYYYRGITALVALLLPSLSLAASVVFTHEDDGKLRLDLVGNPEWGETVLVQIVPANAIIWSDGVWPMVREIGAGKRITLGRIISLPGLQATAMLTGKPGRYTAKHAESYRYFYPVDSMWNGAGDPGRGSFTEKVSAARTGVVAEVNDSSRHELKQVVVYQPDGTIADYLGLTPLPGIRPGVRVGVGDVIGETVSGVSFTFHVKVATDHFVPEDQYRIVPSYWRPPPAAATELVLPTPASTQKIENTVITGKSPDVLSSWWSRVGVWQRPVQLIGSIGLLAMIFAVVSRQWTRQRPTSSRRPSKNRKYRPEVTQAGPLSEPHLDAYACLLRSVQCDVERADALVRQEIERGSPPSRAAFDAIARLKHDSE